MNACTLTPDTVEVCCDLWCPSSSNLEAILRRDPPESYLQKNKLLRARDEKFHGLSAQRESCKKMTRVQRFWVKETRHSETISDEKCYLHSSSTRLLLTTECVCNSGDDIGWEQTKA